MNNSLVSIIVPTYNSAEFLEDCLQSVKNQTYDNIELIVVDNNSMDNTKEIAKKFTDKVFNKGPERCTQRNFGVKQADGEFVAIIDSDMKLATEVIEQCVNKMQEDERVAGVIIPEESFGEGFWAKCKKLERSFYVGIDWMEAARFFKRSDYLNIGGYDEEMVSGEDWDLSQRMEKLGRLERVDAFIYHNEGKISLFKTVKKKFYYAQKFAKYTAKKEHSNKATNQTSILARYKMFLSQPKKLFKNPIIGVGMLFMKTTEFAFGGIGLLVGKFKK